MKRALAALATLAALCLAFSLNACSRQRPLTPQEHATVTELTNNLKTYCVGRYLIDMPADAHIRQDLTVEGVTFEAQPMTLDEYHQAMRKRSEVLNAIKSPYGYRFLYADTVVKGIPESRYFLSLGTSVNTTPDSKRLIEAYKWSRGYQIKLQVEASEAKNSIRFKDDPAVRDDPAMNNAARRMHLVVSMLDRVQGRADDEIPSEPGLCFQGGFMSGNALLILKENISTMFVLDSHRDVNFMIDTDSNITTTDSLLQRGAEIREALSHNSGRTVRNGKVALQGLPAEEWLMAGVTTIDIPGFHFLLEANALIGGPQSPLINLTMDVGAPNWLLDYDHRPQNGSLTEGEAIALWDTVSRTLRPRPNGF